MLVTWPSTIVMPPTSPFWVAEEVKALKGIEKVTPLVKLPFRLTKSDALVGEKLPMLIVELASTFCSVRTALPTC
jgi:hypothetical protein